MDGLCASGVTMRVRELKYPDNKSGFMIPDCSGMGEYIRGGYVTEVVARSTCCVLLSRGIR